MRLEIKIAGTEADSFTSREAALLLGVTEQTLRLWRIRSKGPQYVKPHPRHVLYPRVAIERWIASGSAWRWTEMSQRETREVA